MIFFLLIREKHVFTLNHLNSKHCKAASEVYSVPASLLCHWSTFSSVLSLDAGNIREYTMYRSGVWTNLQDRTRLSEQFLVSLVSRNQLSEEGFRKDFQSE
jgi:hypothetical protein